MRHRTMVVLVTAVTVAIGGAVAGTTAATRALFSDTADGTGSGARAATVELGHGGGTVHLDYPGLRPGQRHVVDLTISYVGTVPADIMLEIAPSGSPALCVQRRGQWQARRGGAVTVAIGSAAPVSYCELLNGRVLTLVPDMPPGSQRHVDVAVLLSNDAGPNLHDRVERDVLTVRAAGGGFTDHATGTVTITTAGRDRDGSTRPPGGGDAARGTDAAGSAATGDAAGGPVPEGRPVSLPAECGQAGMRLDSFEDVIVLGPGRHRWRAPEQRGQGAGPFLVVGSDGDDEIVGSEHADCLVGGRGRDSLAGHAGEDVLIGGAGDDLLDGGPGNDRLFGGPGADELRDGDAADRIDGEVTGPGTTNSTEPAGPPEKATAETPEPGSAATPPPDTPTGQADPPGEAEPPGEATADPPAPGAAADESPPAERNTAETDAPPPNSPAPAGSPAPVKGPV